MGIVYVLLGPHLDVTGAYLLPQEWARQIGDRHFGATSSWNDDGIYYGPFSRLADDFAGTELHSGTAAARLRDVLHPATCFGSSPQ